MKALHLTILSLIFFLSSTSLFAEECTRARRAMMETWVGEHKDRYDVAQASYVELKGVKIFHTSSDTPMTRKALKDLVRLDQLLVKIINATKDLREDQDWFDEEILKLSHKCYDETGDTEISTPVYNLYKELYHWARNDRLYSDNDIYDRTKRLIDNTRNDIRNISKYVDQGYVREVGASGYLE